MLKGFFDVFFCASFIGQASKDKSLPALLKKQLLLPLFMLTGLILAQPGPDSLKKLIHTDTNDSLRAIHNLMLTRYYYNNGKTDSGVYYGQEAHRIAVRIKSEWLKSSAYTAIGVCYYYGGDYKNALSNYLLSLKIEEKLGRKIRAAKIYNNIGTMYMDQRFYDLAETHILKASNLYEEENDTAGIIQVSNNLGVLYGSRSQEKMDPALSAAWVQKALEYNGKTYRMALHLKDSVNIANALANLGQNYMYLKNYKLALKSLNESLVMEKKLDRTYDIGITLLEIGDVLSRTKDYTGAVKYLSDALVIGNQIANPEIIKFAYANLAENYALMGDFKKAFDAHKSFTEVNDSLINTESTKQIHELQIAFDTEKKEKENALLQEKNNNAAITIRQQRYFGIFIGVICVLLVVVAIIIFRANKQKQKINLQLERKNLLIERQKELVEEKQKEILDSIHYARRIQRSLLTSERYIARSLERLNNRR